MDIKDINIDPTANVLKLVEEAVRRIDDLQKAFNSRQEDLRNSEIKRMEDIMDLRCAYEEKLRVAEAERLNSIRAVDTAAISLNNERVISQAQAIATQSNNIHNAITDRISALEKQAYVVTGKDTGIKNVWAYLVAGVGVFFGLVGIILTVIHLLK